MRPASRIARHAREAGLVALLVLAAGPAARAQEVVIEGARLVAGSVTYEAPRLLVRGSPLPEAELRRLLDPAGSAPMAERVARLEAEEIVAPELIATLKLAQIDQRTTYREVSFKRVAGGRIGSISSAVGAMEGTQQGRKVTGSNGALALHDVDAGAVVELLTKPGGPDAPMRRLYGGFSLDAVRVIDSMGVTTEIGRLAGGEFSARPTSAGWLATFDALAAPDPDKASAEQAAKAMDALAELVDSVSVGSIEVSDVAMKGKVEKDDVDLAVSLKRLAYDGAGQGRSGELRIENLAVAADGARLRTGLLAFGGLDAKPLVAALREVSGNPADPNPAVLRRLLPAISSLRMEDVDVDVPAEGAVKRAAERTRFSFGRFEIATGRPVDGLPSDIRVAMRNVAFAVPPNPEDAGAAMLTQLGYDRVEGSFGLSLGWNEAGREIAIRDVAIDAKDMGVATVRGVLGNVGRDVFDADTAVAAVALAGAAARSLQITLEDRGLFDRIIRREASRQKRPPEDVRREYGLAASVGIPAILGASPSSRALAQSVGRFVAKPGKLSVLARAKRPAGYGIADYMANPTPGGVLEAIDITATAE